MYLLENGLLLLDARKPLSTGGESVSFSQAKEYNAFILQRRNSVGKDEGSVNRRGTEPSVFVSGVFSSLIHARHRT